MKYVLDASIAVKWVLLAKAVDMASQARIGVYDCLYVALARLEQCRVITADQRLLTRIAHRLLMPRGRSGVRPADRSRGTG